MSFKEDVRALYGQYGKDIKKIRDDSTIEMFSRCFKNPSPQVKPTIIQKLLKGKFYIIRYNYNGNKIWCPIFTIDFRIYQNKNILFAINFDYLPTEYKVILIDNLLDDSTANFNANVQFAGKDAMSEQPIKNITFENTYSFLKRNAKKEYCITAYDVLKIEKIYVISTTILHRFVFIDTFYINRKMMLDTLMHTEDQKIKLDLMKKIEKYEELAQLYEQDIEKFHKALRNFEDNLKLYK